jgi:hypothetical protein
MASESVAPEAKAAPETPKPEVGSTLFKIRAIAAFARDGIGNLNRDEPVPDDLLPVLWTIHDLAHDQLRAMGWAE